MTNYKEMSSSWQSVPNAINFRDVLRKTRPVSERKRRRRPQSVPNTIDSPRKERGVSLYESNVNNRRDNAIYEDLPAVAGVSVARNKRMPLFWDICF